MQVFYTSTFRKRVLYHTSRSYAQQIEKEGAYKKAIETAKRLHQIGLSLEKISEAVSLSLEEVKQILHI